jgi:pyruvate-ferredoxin/flavodoxin oxidoreductase
MAEVSDVWSGKGMKNVYGTVPEVIQMQSEGGVAGAVHGALMGGTLTTTFTASQGLLLMIPDLFRIAGELTPFVMHVAARAIATSTLSIFAEHSDVMACRQTGVAMLVSGSGQEAQDLAAVAHAATLEARLPFMHFFDGFRTSHEISKVQTVGDEVLASLINRTSLAEFRDRGLSPDHPTARGTASNPDTFFQSREACNAYYERCAEIVEKKMAAFGKATGRHYKPFDYEGHPQAERVIVVMGSGAETVGSTVQYLEQNGEKVGVVKVRLYRPFDIQRFLAALPASTRQVVVLDRTKEPGASGEPLYLDVVNALSHAQERGIKVVGGRFGLGSKEFEPCMVKAVFQKMAGELPQSFTIGINDDVTGRSISYDPSFHLPLQGVTRALFYGLGSDGTVGANKNTIKIIGEDTPLFAQGYFVYDSKKSGGLTVSHLRFGPEPIRAPYLIRQAEFIAVHQPIFLRQMPEIFEAAVPGATLLVNFSGDDTALWAHLSASARKVIRERNCSLYRIDGAKVARDNGMGRHINGVMQAAFFSISGLLPQKEALARIQEAIRKTYASKGEEVVHKNCEAALAASAALVKVHIPEVGELPDAVGANLIPSDASDFVKNVTMKLIKGKGDELPVSAIPADGIWPTGTSRYEKRSIADFIPEWNPEACTQCNQCSLICPHAAIRATFVSEADLANAPEGFKSLSWKGPGAKPGERFIIQVSPADCTGCKLCVSACPRGGDQPTGKPVALAMKPLDDARMATESVSWNFFEKLPEPPKERLDPTPRTLVMRKPLFEFSGACAGCGQTSYVRTLTQLFGDRMILANGTGCSSIYGGNLPTTPYTKNAAGRGPAWANSLFEENAEFGYGLMVSSLRRRNAALVALDILRSSLPEELVQAIHSCDQKTDAGVEQMRELVGQLKSAIKGRDSIPAQELLQQADYLVRKTVWTMGGDGWAYDIGYGGLDHVLASGRNVNVLVLDTEVYSNTGGQMSKSTPIGATARFASTGKAIAKKDLTGIAMSYGYIYVAQISIGANARQAIDALREAESYDGPSLVVAYAPCIEHGVELSKSLERQKLAVKTGYWNLFRHDPRRIGTAEPVLKMDSSKPSLNVMEFMKGENRFRRIVESDSSRAEMIATQAQENVNRHYEKLLAMSKVVTTPVEAASSPVA